MAASALPSIFPPTRPCAGYVRNVHFPVNTPNSGQKGQSAGAPEGNPLSIRVQIEQIASVLAWHRRRKSLRVLAKEVGISKSSVDELVKAYNQCRELPEPYGNWQKLKDWYLATQYSETGQLREPVDLAILALELIADLPEPERRAGLQQLVDSVGRIYDSAKTARPAWLQRLEKGLRESAQDDPP